ncbi:MAG: D-lyxose/D-mannose family sugar isomerase [Planctomycetes bacterium]|nr:D-lyxose/D-mannose family sugar isomerase [Planctomycetota bacterium]
MRRSEINRLIEQGLDFLARAGAALPPQARWDLETWRARSREAAELLRRGIGWDLTDFGLGDFRRQGLLLYTLSNGIPGGATVDQPYANKLLLVRAGQATPAHNHGRKIEDIMVLRGGRLQIELFNVGDDGAPDRAREVTLLKDGMWHSCPAGARLSLGPGERVRLEPHHYHGFWGEPGAGDVLVEEVSSLNDDLRDNFFAPEERVGRFPALEEDEAPRFLLCTELPGSAAFDRLLAAAARVAP